jgi:hypothetical protein
MIDVDHERLVLVAEEYGATVGGGHDPLDSDGDDVFLHGEVKVESSPVSRKQRGACLIYSGTSILG